MTSNTLRFVAIVTLGWVATQGTAIAQEEARYVFGPESTVTYRVTHPIHGATGVSHELRGSIEVVLGGNPTLRLPMKLSIPIQSFDSGNRNRDRNMLSTMNAARYPTAALEITSVTWSSQHTQGEKVLAEGVAKGTLSLHGTNQSVEIPVAGSADPQRLEVKSKFSILLSKYGVDRPSLFFRAIDDEVPIEVTGIAHRK